MASTGVALDDRESLLARIAALETENAILHTERAQREAEDKELRLINGQPLPPIARFFGTSSDPMGSSQHPNQPVRKISMLHVSDATPFGFSADGSHFVSPAHRTVRSSLRADHKGVFPKKLLWSNEADVQSYVVTLLGDVLRAAGLRTKLQLLQQTQVSEFRPDIWVISHDGQPLGVVEVKAPVSDHALADIVLPRRDSTAWSAVTPISDASAATDDAMPRAPGDTGPGGTQPDKATVYHQITYYMLMLKECFGVEHVFGIITTYDEWRVCWFPESNGIAEAVTLSAEQYAYLRHPEREPAESEEVMRHRLLGAAYCHDNLSIVPTSTLLKRAPSLRRSFPPSATPDSALNDLVQQLETVGLLLSSSTATSPGAGAACRLPTAVGSKQASSPGDATPPTTAALAAPESAATMFLHVQADPFVPEPVQRNVAVQLQVSQVYRSTAVELPLILCAAVTKMALARPTASHFDRPTRYFLRVSPTVLEWAMMSFSAPLQFDVMAPPQANAVFYLIAPLCGGINGIVWLVRNTSGRLFVLKFALDTLREDALKAEYERWVDIYPSLKAYVSLCPLGPAKHQRLALLMPRLAHVTRAQASDLGLLDQVAAAVDAFLDRGYEHTDLSWRHVGLYRDPSETAAPRVVFFDLGAVVPCRRGAECEAARARMRVRLELS